MRKEVFFFLVESEVEELDVEFEPFSPGNIEEIEKEITSKGLVIEDMWKEELKEKELYEDEIFGYTVRYGFFIYRDKLHFVFTFPELVEKIRREYSIRLKREFERRFPRGYLIRTFEPLGKFQIQELVLNRFYVGVEF